MLAVYIGVSYLLYVCSRCSVLATHKMLDSCLLYIDDAYLLYAEVLNCLLPIHSRH